MGSSLRDFALLTVAATLVACSDRRDGFIAPPTSEASAPAPAPAPEPSAEPEPELVITEVRQVEAFLGVEPDRFGRRMRLSRNGRFCVFESRAMNLVADDTTTASDIFVADLAKGEIERVSVASDGREGNGNSSLEAVGGGGVISDDGRYVVFASSASNLVPDDTNSNRDIFVRDRVAGTTIRVNDGDSQGNVGEGAVSGNGRFVAFVDRVIDASGDTVFDVFLRDLETGQLEHVSVGIDGDFAGGCSQPKLSADGRFVIFDSLSSKLVADDTNNTTDVFLRDRQAETTTRISVSTAGVEGDQFSFLGQISPNGAFAVFSSPASNLVDGDTNSASDIFLRDIQAGTTRRVSLGIGGAEVAGSSDVPSVADDGSVVFSSAGDNLVEGDTNERVDVFLWSPTGGTALLSRALDGGSADSDSDRPSISGDGRFAVFRSRASNLEGGNQRTRFFITPTGS